MFIICSSVLQKTWIKLLNSYDYIYDLFEACWWNGEIDVTQVSLERIPECFSGRFKNLNKMKTKNFPYFIHNRT